VVAGAEGERGEQTRGDDGRSGHSCEWVNWHGHWITP
jgi:hypothetical protein